LTPDSDALKLDTTSSHILASLRGAVVGGDERQMLARGGLSPSARRRVREHVEANLAEGISVGQLAALVGLSRCHFARAFKRSEGVTPRHFLCSCRVRRAQELLVKTDLPLARIAIAAGFTDQSHCSRRFRELMGITPGEYRRLMRRGNDPYSTIAPSAADETCRAYSASTPSR
jgi:transcriptional regulator GlxA family with amidase domain